MQACLRFCRGGVSKAQPEIAISRAQCRIYLGPICDFEFGSQPAESTQVRRRTAGLRPAEAAARSAFSRPNLIMKDVLFCNRAAACEERARADAEADARSGPSRGEAAARRSLRDRFCLQKVRSCWGGVVKMSARWIGPSGPAVRSRPGRRAATRLSLVQLLCKLRPVSFLILPFSF